MKLLNRAFPVIICMLLLFVFFPVPASAEAELMESGTFGAGFEWEITYEEKGDFEEEITLIISGTGAMPDFSTWTEAPWIQVLTDYGFSVDQIVICEGISAVGDYSFSYYDRLVSVTLPQSLERIGLWAFGGCSSLSSVTVPSGCTTIGGAAFFECTALTSVIIPPSCAVIGDQAFYGCSRLRSVTFEGDAPAIGNLSFYGVTAAAWCSCLKEGWDEDTMLQYGADKLTWSTHAFDEGTVIREPTCTEDGVRRFTCCYCEETFDQAILTNGHTEEIDPAVEPNFGKEGLTEGSHCSVCGEILTAQQPVLHLGYILEVPENAGGTVLEINGVPCETDEDGRIILRNRDALFATAYGYGESAAEDQKKLYPSSMRVYRLSYEEDAGTCSAEELAILSNLLTYTGFSIRTTGVPGIRMITAVRESLKEYLVDTGFEGYKLAEYGTLVQQESALSGRSLTFETEGVKHAAAFEKGKSDPVFARSGGNVLYTNVLVGFSLDQCGQELVMRPYMKFRNDEGEELYLYGGRVSRSIGFIALQNKDAFRPGTKEYEYIWSMIRAAYGSAYAGSYKTN